MMSKQTHHSRQPHTLSSMPMSLGWTLYFYFLHLLFPLFLLLALSAPLPWSVHCKHQSAPSTSINQLAFPFSRSVRQHHSHNHNHIQWPLSVAQRSLHNPFTPNSSYDKNVKRFSTERKSKHNGSRHQSRQRKVKPKTSINSGGQVPSWAQSGAGQHSSNISLLLDQLLLGYDSHVRPNFGGSALEVQVDMHIRSMGPISEVEMTYVIDCYFRQSWKDSRLAYKNMPIFQNFSNLQRSNSPNNSHNQNTTLNALALSIFMLDRIWRPTTFFHNSRSAVYHVITQANKFVRIYSNGQVLYSSRMTIKANCPMNLERFPMDTQRCPLTLGSFGYTSKDLIYNWNPTRKVVINPDLKMSQFDLITVPVSSYNISMQTSSLQQNYSVLVATFHFKRHSAAFVIEVYAPCVMLTVLSWVGFWINREATADRVTLGLTTVLTMTFLGLEIRTDLPKVPYLTALDYFVYISFAFISATILEFGFVHFFTKIGSGEYYFMPIQDANRNEHQNSFQRKTTFPKRVDGSKMSRSVDQIMYNWSPVEVKRSASWSISPKTDAAQNVVNEVYTRPEQDVVHSEYSQIGVDNVFYNSNRLTTFRNSLRNRLRHSFRNRSTTHRKSVVSLNGHDVCKTETPIRVQLNSVSQIDRASRLIFPIAFLLMNFVYWYIYLSAEREIDTHPF